MKKDRSRKLKHGALAAAITALAIALVIVLNIGISAIASARLWYFDMTEEAVFTISDETKEILSSVDSEVNIYFAKDEDAIMSGDGTNRYMKYIYNTARELEKEFDFVNVKCVDVVENPAFFEYYYNTAATNILTTSVIVESNGEFRLFSSDAFFVWDENRTYIWGYNGESKFAAAILQVTSADMPKICFTEGHGEKSLDECRAFRELCEAAGYEVGTIDLSKEEIGDDVRIIIINDPVYDFAGLEAGENGSEIDRLSAFLDGFGTVMLFADSERAKNLTNLSEMLYEWGVGFRPGQVLRDDSNSLTVDGRTLVADYETGNTLGASFYSAISELSSMPKTIVPDAMPLEIYFDVDQTSSGEYVASAILCSHAGAEVTENGATEKAGRLPLFTVTRREKVKDNDYFHSYVAVCGSPSFVADKYLNSNSYANSDILVNAIRATGREKIVADIDIKVFDDTSLEITTSQTNTLTAVFGIVIPIVIAAAGSVICFRRRRT